MPFRHPPQLSRWQAPRSLSQVKPQKKRPQKPLRKEVLMKVRRSNRDHQSFRKLMLSLGVSEKAWEIMASGRDYGALSPAEKSLVARTVKRMRETNVIRAA